MGIWTEVIMPERLAMQPYAGRKVLVSATYKRNGMRRVGNHTYLTVLIENIRHMESGTVLTDHLWFNRGNLWRRAELRPGDRIAFQARVLDYRTGYWGPEKIRRLENPPRVEYGLTPPEGLVIIRSARGSRRPANASQVLAVG